ncbi:unnamed protein product [Parnassius apollo]|uniref:(apollo) hypothetical protein n=1 Tax=Parnassius apollo TaxID=110799 RepID=A0A8S3XDX9_PARAO|nr:unnamed protein product [Parnassius apollo]
MEHIRQFDWCYSEPDYYFVKEEDLDNCVTEKILRNQFHNPLAMASSDSEDEKPTFDWDKIFSRNETGNKQHRIFVPGFRGLPPFPKLSALTHQQHYQCLKVLCAQNPHILVQEFVPRPTKQDYRVFEEVQTVYAREQKEFIEWAKSLWTSEHCIRALRPKPPVETAYEAEFEIRAKGLESYPKIYQMAAQIPLETNNEKFNMVFEKELISVDISMLPQIKNPEPIRSRLSIISPLTVPEPCTKHPCRFVLPNETATTILPLTEVHRELAQYALENGAHFVASEKSLKCLIEVDRHWTICLSVCEAFTPDGEKRKILVLGNEFSIMRECAQIRTYRAFRHLLQYAFVPDLEKSKLFYKNNKRLEKKNDLSIGVNEKEDREESSDDEDTLFIVAGNKLNFLTSLKAFIFLYAALQAESIRCKKDTQANGNSDADSMETDEVKSLDEEVSKQTKVDAVSSPVKGVNGNKNKAKDKNDFYKCTCEDTMFERPPPRSFRKWRVRNITSQENYDVIVHCAHKVKGEVGEVILEPIPEYQLDLGASQLSKEKIRSLALSLYLRKNASLMNVRIEGSSGDVVRCDTVSLDELVKSDGDMLPAISRVVGTTLDQLQGLLPGHYLLQHEPSHGTNALLYSPRLSAGEERLTLDFGCKQLAEADEAKSLKRPPILAPILLPAHKFRKILPCAFTPNETQVAKETRKPPSRQKAPPQALTWPKKRGRKPKRKN